VPEPLVVAQFIARLYAPRLVGAYYELRAPWSKVENNPPTGVIYAQRASQKNYQFDVKSVSTAQADPPRSGRILRAEPSRFALPATPQRK
jgi:hypothetical protein